MPHIAGHPQIGATPVDDGTDDPQTFKYDLYTLKQNTPDLGGRKLQNIYGRTTTLDGVTTVMPSYQWLKTIKTGEATYTDTSAADRALLAQAKADYDAAGGASSGLEDPMDIIKAEITPVAAQLGEGIGASIATSGEFSGKSIYEGLPFTKGAMDVPDKFTSFGALKSTPTTVDSFDALKTAGMKDGLIETANIPEGIDVDKLGGVTGASVADGGFLQGGSFLDNLNLSKDLGMQNFKSAAGGAVGNFAVQLALGQDPVKAAKSAGAGAIGKMLGTAIGGPIGGFIGGALGSILGGRVICNELMRQGLLTRKEVILDYRFTRDYLTPTHVNGYHVWAVWMVKQMRKGKFVKFWKHIAGHRANEIAYIYGQRDTPDYLGKVYRKILEPTCWVVGSFCKVTDWSVLYKQKEI